MAADGPSAATASQPPPTMPKPPSGPSPAADAWALRSFASVVAAKNSNAPSMIKKPTTYKGEPAFIFTKEEMAKLSAPYVHALVGKFPAGRPNIFSLRRAFATIGLTGAYTIGLLDHRHILIRLSSEEDYTRLFIKGSWQILSFNMRILKWTPFFRTDIEPSLVPVWITFDHLPVEFYNKDVLWSFAELYGTPLKVDLATAKVDKPHSARVCVEMDVRKSHPTRFFLGDDDVGIYQEAIFENMPEYCNDCCELGHRKGNCASKGGREDAAPKPPPPPNKPQVKQAWKPKETKTAAVAQDDAPKVQKNAEEPKNGEEKSEEAIGVGGTNSNPTTKSPQQSERAHTTPVVGVAQAMRTIFLGVGKNTIPTPISQTTESTHGPSPSESKDSRCIVAEEAELLSKVDEVNVCRDLVVYAKPQEFSFAVSKGNGVTTQSTSCENLQVGNEGINLMVDLQVDHANDLLVVDSSREQCHSDSDVVAATRDKGKSLFQNIFAQNDNFSENDESDDEADFDVLADIPKSIFSPKLYRDSQGGFKVGNHKLARSRREAVTLKDIIQKEQSLRKSSRIAERKEKGIQGSYAKFA